MLDNHQNDNAAVPKNADRVYYGKSNRISTINSHGSTHLIYVTTSHQAFNQTSEKLKKTKKESEVWSGDDDGMKKKTKLLYEAYDLGLLVNELIDIGAGCGARDYYTAFVFGKDTNATADQHQKEDKFLLAPMKNNEAVDCIVFMTLLSDTYDIGTEVDEKEKIMPMTKVSILFLHSTPPPPLVLSLGVLKLLTIHNMILYISNVASPTTTGSCH